MSIANCRDLRPIEVEENKEDFTVVWLDGNIDDSPDSLQTQTRLRNVNNYCQFYTNIQLCLDFIRTVNNEQIFLIVSGVLARSILPQIHSLRSLASVFIFCANCHNHLSLLKEYPKVVKIFPDENSLIESIPKAICLASNQTLSFSLFDQKQKSTKDLSKDSPSFLWYQLLIDVLRQMPQTDHAKQQMLDTCSNCYRGNKRQLEQIQQFQSMYTPADAVSWYTADSFVYRLLNKAFRIEDMELVYIFRFFIFDLCTQLERGHRALRESGERHLKLFRGQQIPNEEFDKLKQSVGILISTNGFWSTTRDLNVALSFIPPGSQTDGMQQVLFEISADPSLETVVFAAVDQQSRMSGEQEVLFGLGAVFKVELVQFDLHLKLWKIKMAATDDGSRDFNEYLQSTKKEMEENSPTILFGRLLLIERGQVAKAEKYFEMLLKTLPCDHEDMASVYNGIGSVYDTKRELNLALEYYNKAYEMRLRLLEQHHPHISGSLCIIGNIYRHKGDYDRAMEYYHQSLTIDEKNYPADHLSKARILRNIGLAHKEKKDFERALEYLRRALQMFQRMLPNEHPEIALSLGFIGLVFKDNLDYDQALKYFHKELEMDEKVLSSDHRYLSEHIEWIADTYKKKGETERGFEFCQEKLADQKRKLGENHPTVAQTLQIMGDLLANNDAGKALECYNQALSILEIGSSPVHLATARCLSSISLVYLKYDRFDEALSFRIRALEIEQKMHSSDNINIANSLRSIGLIYSKMANYPKALEYLTNGLKIYAANYTPQHEDIKKIENDIAEVKTKMNLVMEEPVPIAMPSASE
jgi:tetratricopeptide (TPR) repeat protein